MREQSPDRVFIFDTTLRDGEQSPGFHLDSNSKLRIARQLERLGVDVIEAGFPISSPGDFESCRRVAREIRGATVTALARAVRDDIDAVWGAIRDAEDPQIHIVLSVSDVHIQRKLGMTREQVLQRGREMVEYARFLCDKVEYSPEDAGRADPDYLIETVETMIAAGANVINIPDTTGYCLPYEFGELIRRVINEARGSENALFSVHCHNDLGLAVANTLAALAAGARRVECTINGIGERAGNTSLEEIVMLLKVRQNKLGLECGIDTTEITRTSRLVSELTGTPVQPNKAVVGANAFAHASGIHQDGVLKDRLNYEIMKPEDVGLADSRIVLTARSGRHAFHHRLSRLGITLSDSSKADAAWQRFLQLADTKKEVTDEDLRKIAAMSESNGHEGNGHPPVTDQLHDHNHVADTLRHLIFG
ncbi:MAG TPA: 2-isopropylmalate synthase [Candidatus Dormibacteraeota bacterium]|nr:2-isopropylmalate synthase [Candidatus Dormibacteraeota bacterium]